MEALRKANIWVMTVKPDIEEDLSLKEDNFEAKAKESNGSLILTLSGRLDTITAPALLSLYKEKEAQGAIKDITIDLKNLEYISSAGLRVLLIMKKALGEKGQFNLLNMNEDVSEIIKTTGFDSVFFTE